MQTETLTLYTCYFTQVSTGMYNVNDRFDSNFISSYEFVKFIKYSLNLYRNIRYIHLYCSQIYDIHVCVGCSVIFHSYISIYPDKDTHGK